MNQREAYNHNCQVSAELIYDMLDKTVWGSKQ